MELCLHPEHIELDGETFSAAEIVEVLGAYLTSERRERIAAVVAGRTYSVVPVMEGLYDRGNVSAVLRSAEALGYQAVHNIDSCQNFKEAKRVTQGAEKWLDITVWEQTAPCLAHLRERGYRILATHLEDAQPITDFAFDVPTALIFGNEKEGVSEEALAAADARVVLPMSGFTQSFNISVAAALCLYEIQQDRIRRMGTHGDLSDAEQVRLTAALYLRSIEFAEHALLKHLAERQSPDWLS